MRTSLWSAPGRQIVRSVAMVMLAAVALAAQDKPDFSGRWVLADPVPPAPDIPRALSVRQSLLRANVHGEPVTPSFKDIVVDREFESGSRSETYLIGVVGGTVSGLSTPGGQDGAHTDWKVAWERNALVFESGTYSAASPESGVSSERRETWSLEADGRLRVTISTRSSSDVSRTVTLIYRRS